MLALHLGTAAALGLASSLHCVAMCGPLVAGSCATRGDAPAAGGPSPERLMTTYLLGRLVGYGAMGALAGLAAAPWLMGSASVYVRAAAGIIVGLGLVRTALRWLLPPPSERPITLGRGPADLGRPKRSSLARFVPARGLGLGLVTALFPCGTLLGGLLAAASSGSASVGSAMMVVFALVTSPALLATMALGGRLGRSLGRGRGRAKQVLATTMLMLAAWTMAGPLSALLRPSGDEAMCHGR